MHMLACTRPNHHVSIRKVSQERRQTGNWVGAVRIQDSDDIICGSHNASFEGSTIAVIAPVSKHTRTHGPCSVCRAVRGTVVYDDNFRTDVMLPKQFLEFIYD